MKEKILTISIVSLMMLAGFGIFTSESVARSHLASAPKGPTIVDVAVAANGPGGAFEGEFDILIAAVVATPKVAEILSGNGQHTVFAPTDGAFESLADELNLTLNELVEFLLNNTEYLEDVLLYHIAHGRLYAEDVLEKDQINTLIRGRDGFLMQSNGVLTDNLYRDSNIIVTDIEAANGIIHAIDTVVLPYLP